MFITADSDTEVKALQSNLQKVFKQSADWQTFLKQVKK